MKSLELPWKNIKTRGLTLIQFRRYLLEKFGEEETSRVISALPEETAATIINVKKGEWYPFETQRKLREAIIKKIDPKDPLGVMYRMGLVTSSWDFSGFLKPFFSFIPVETILNRSAALWGKYYNQGQMKVAAFEGNTAVLQLSEFPADLHFYPIVTSWMMTALQTLRKPNPKVAYSRVTEQKPEIDRFELSWG